MRFKSLMRILKLLLFLPLLLLWAGCGQRQETPPNFLIILSDDQRFDSMPYMPQTTDLIFDQGLTFDSAYITTSRCCPSRATILTGMYAHTHNVRVNSDQLEQPTVVAALHENGYTTGLVGKYLNSYPTQPEDPPRPEFDYWIGMISGTNSAKYFDTPLNVNGEWIKHSGYQMDILRDYALAFLQEANEKEQPFYLLFSPYTPHLPALPAPGDENLYPDLPPHQPPNFNPADMGGKPEWMQALPILNEESVASINNDNRRILQSLNALDETVATFMEVLAEQDQLDNTVVIYLSDNGFFLGEHRLPIGKIYAYEESTHVPFAIRYPPLIEAGSSTSRVVGNIDLAPTIYDLAGLSVPDTVDGTSLRPLFENPATPAWREQILLEGWPINVAYVGNSPPYQAMHTGRYVYIETAGDLSELYDLESDPYQLHNVIDDPAYDEIEAVLKQALVEERQYIQPAPESSGAFGVEMP